MLCIVSEAGTSRTASPKPTTWKAGFGVFVCSECVCVCVPVCLCVFGFREEGVRFSVFFQEFLGFAESPIPLQ